MELVISTLKLILRKMSLRVQNASSPKRSNEFRRPHIHLSCSMPKRGF
jgi:hypothetical protein